MKTDEAFERRWSGFWMSVQGGARAVTSKVKDLLSSASYSWLIILLLWPSVSAAQDFVVHRERFAGPAIVGVGAEMNPYLYCTPNAARAGETAPVDDLENKIVALRPQLVRVFVLKHWFDGRADPISKGDPRTADSFFRTVALAQRAGAAVNITYWYDPGWAQPRQQMEWFAGLLAEMIHQRKLTSVRYVTVQNEPNLHEDKISKDLYTRLYLELDRALSRAGIGRQIGIISGDLVQDNQQAWFQMLGAKLSRVSAGYSIHAYWDFWDPDKILRRLELPRRIVDALPPAEQRPLFVTEFGVRGRNHNGSTNDPGEFDDGSPIATQPLQAAELGEFILEALRRGYIGLVVWTMDDSLYDHPMQYGLIGSAKDGWPLKPGYRLIQLLTHTIRPGWRALAIDGSRQDVSLAAVAGKRTADIAVLALNHSNQPVTIRIGGLPPGLMLHQARWNHAGRAELTRGATASTDAAGSAAMALAPLSLVVLTPSDPKLIGQP